MSAKDTLKNFGKKITPAYITKLAVLTGISFILYMFAKFSLPFMFPSFLDMQFSELPAIFAGFSLGPVAGVLVIVLKCLLKFPFTATAFVGELTDMVLGILYVLPASIIYYRKKTRKTAVIALITGTVASTLGAILLNRFVSIPFYVQFYFGGNFDTLINVFCKPLYHSITRENFYLIYLSAAVLPFNILRLSLVSVVTFLVYKSLSKALHWEIKPRKVEAPAEEPTEQVPVTAEAQTTASENSEN
ncbi:MAG: ECF transporter S component [Clostridia bacterium]|nr:ECF transporter S component [Clostridia bacterium]